jgi:hypothetical protein
VWIVGPASEPHEHKSGTVLNPDTAEAFFTELGS